MYASTSDERSRPTARHSSPLASETIAIPPTDPCPCGRPGSVAECCGPYLAGERLAPDPESLMRSRYTAFALGTPAAVDYLVSTHHPDHRGPHLARDLRASITGVDAWEQLEVQSAAADGDLGTVEFIAHYRLGQERRQLHEHSEFVRVDGHWLYTQGTVR